MDQVQKNQNEDSHPCCIEVQSEEPCVVCGTPTKYIEYCVERRLCCKECIDHFYKEITAHLGDIPPWDDPDSECYECQTHSIVDCEKCTRC